MKKNVGSQVVGAQMITAADGTAFTGSVTVYVTGDGGTQAAGSVGSGACTHEGNGFHTYVPAQAETNYDHVAFTFTGTGAVPHTVQVYTSFPQTGDSYARLGAPAGASVSADVAAVKAQTAAIETDTGTDLPATLSTIAGYLDTEIAAILADTNELQTDWANGGRLDLLIDAIKAKTDNLPTDPADASDIAAAIAALNDLSAAEVNAEVVDALATDTYAATSGVPSGTATIVAKISRMYDALINGVDLTATKKQFKNAAGTVQWEKDLSDDGTTYSESSGNAP